MRLSSQSLPPPPVPAPLARCLLTVFRWSIDGARADVISIEKTNENFRLLYDVRGRFAIHRIGAEEAKVRGAPPQQHARRAEEQLRAGTALPLETHRVADGAAR